MIGDEFLKMSIARLGTEYRNRTISPVEVTRALVSRIEQVNPKLNALLTVTRERAIGEAERAEMEMGRGEWRGPLHGIPVAVKDLFYTRGVVTTGGSALYREFVPDYDSSVVSRLSAAGAVMVGKAHMHELAYGVTNENPHFGPCRNPIDPDRIPGGSSGGSAAAVAAGLCFAALGTDTGGSIRIPASYCGVVGFKPTYGRVSRHGVIPLSVNLDTVGAFARRVRDACVAVEVVGGHDPADPSSLPGAGPSWDARLARRVDGMSIGIVSGAFVNPLQADIREGIARSALALEAAGARFEDVEIPDIFEADELAHLILVADGAAIYHRLIREVPNRFGEDVRLLIEQGHLVSAVDYINAQRFRRLFQNKLARLFDRYAALLLPATPVTAPRIGDTTVDLEGEAVDVGRASTMLVRPFNFAGVPVLTVPCARSATGLPFGMQIVTRSGDELTGLEIGAVHEALMETA